VYIPPDFPTRNSDDALTYQADPIIENQVPSTLPIVNDTPNPNDAAPQAAEDDNRRDERGPKAPAKKKKTDDEPGSSKKASQPRRTGRRA
jgi:hypothetical protein